MATVVLTPAAQAELNALPVVIHARVIAVFEQLENWPAVSGAKPLRGNLSGQFRKRTGDYRVQFSVVGEMVTVTKIGHRDGFYDD
jgi:mRNA-degrading endonuclease RelE of RelBE toxin-antitoxin system